MSLSSGKSTFKDNLYRDIRAAYKQSFGRNDYDVETNLNNFCNLIATAISDHAYTWISEAKKPVITITTAPSGTWTAEVEPTSGSGIEVGG